MSTFVKKTEKAEGAQDLHKVRIQLSSRNPKALEKACSDVMLRAKENKIQYRGPLRLPTRNLKMTVRKSPCGNGTASYDTYQMNIYKRLIDFIAPQETVKLVTSINLEAGVTVDVSVTDV